MSPLPDCRYRITPSLLNSFQRYLEPDYEGFWWQDSMGLWHPNYDEETDTYHYTHAEVDELNLKDMLDTINRVESISEAASKGTALNEVVDWGVAGIAPNPLRTIVKTDRDNDRVSVTIKKSRDDDGPFFDDNVFTFPFRRSWVADIVGYFRDSLCQVEVHAPIDTRYGTVEVYGFPDFIRKNRVYDLKTTKRYAFGDHAKGWQKHIYPYALIKSGMMTEIADFEYTIYKWDSVSKFNPLLSGQQFREVYTFDFNYTEHILRQMIERFIEFLEEHRSEITDRKVFGGLEH